MQKIWMGGVGGSLEGMGCVLAASVGWVTKGWRGRQEGWTSQNIDRPTGQNTENIKH